MTEAADVRPARRIPLVWAVPLIAAGLGLWMVIDTYLDEGPVVTVEFATAEAVEAGATKVKVRNVDVGVVKQVRLHENLESVVVELELDSTARRLLRDDTQFWVVRPRIGQSGVSGLDTILSGGYIEIAPGNGKVTSRRYFDGLEEGPITASGTPGLRLYLMGQSTGTINVGSPILYRGFQVGTIERIELNMASHEIEYSAFIDAPYGQLVTTTTRFFNASGISATVGTTGIKVTTGSLQSIVQGGVSFDRPQTLGAGEAVQSGSTFRLYEDQEATEVDPHRYHTEYVVEFNQSVRGIVPDTPVEFRGIQLGTVVRLMLTEAVAQPGADGTESAIPVLIKLEPGRLEMEDSEEGVARLQLAMAEAVADGMRATIETGSLLTGSRIVVLDYRDDIPIEEIGRFQSYQTIPTTLTGIGALEQQVSALLAKLNELPIGETVSGLNSNLATLQSTLGELQTFLANDELRELPASLNATLRKATATLDGVSQDTAPLWDRVDRTNTELMRALQNIERLTRTLEYAPNSVVFPLKHKDDPVPKAEP